jgi:hypothetical protein
MVFVDASDSPKCRTLPLLDQLFHRAGDVLDRDLGIDAVLVEKIDHVRTKTLQRRFDDLLDVRGAAIQRANPLRGVEAELGRDDDLIADGLKRKKTRLKWMPCLGNLTSRPRTRGRHAGVCPPQRCVLRAQFGQYHRPAPLACASFSARALGCVRPASWCQPTARNFLTAATRAIPGRSRFPQTSAVSVPQPSHVTRRCAASMA